jgi:hypothetical protein
MATQVDAGVQANRWNNLIRSFARFGARICAVDLVENAR